MNDKTRNWITNLIATILGAIGGFLGHGSINGQF